MRASNVDPLARVGAVGLGQGAECLPGDRYRGPVTEVFGLGAGQSVEVGRGVEGAARGIDRRAERFVGQIRCTGLISHPALIAMGRV